MGKEKMSRREFLVEVAGYLWGGAIVSTFTESGLRYSSYQREIDEQFPSLDKDSRRKLIAEMSRKKGDEWKDIIEATFWIGSVLAATAASAFIKGPPLMSR